MRVMGGEGEIVVEVVKEMGGGRGMGRGSVGDG